MVGVLNDNPSQPELMLDPAAKHMKLFAGVVVSRDSRLVCYDDNEVIFAASFSAEFKNTRNKLAVFCAMDIAMVYVDDAVAIK